MSKHKICDLSSRKSLSAIILLLGISLLVWTVNFTDAKKKKKVSLDKYTTLVRSTTTTTTTTEATTTEKLEELYPVPTADSSLTSKLLKLVKDASLKGLLERGTNRATRAVKEGVANIIIMAADTWPIDVLRRTINICRLDEIPYVFVPKQNDLGAACGLPIAAASCAIISKANETSLKNDIKRLKHEILRITREQKDLPPPTTTPYNPLFPPLPLDARQLQSN